MKEIVIELVFHNRGLRSYIEADLCLNCPRQDQKGCCGLYSPVFYPTDLAYILQENRQVIDDIFSFNDITVLDYSVTLNNDPDDTGYRCKFHTLDAGCKLPQHLRESICRHFVCPGISWWTEAALAPWKKFFEALEAYELAVNNRISDGLKQKNLSLRKPEHRDSFYRELCSLFQEETKQLPEFIEKFPQQEKYILKRKIDLQSEWPL